MNAKIKISIGLSAFLTIAPILGSLITNEMLGEYIGNLTPYVHLGIAEVGGLPFADAFAGLFSFIIITIGFLGFIILVCSKFRKTGLLRLLLYLTVIYCMMRASVGLLLNALQFKHYETSMKALVITTIAADVAWGLFCLWAVNILERDRR